MVLRAGQVQGSTSKCHIYPIILRRPTEMGPSPQLPTGNFLEHLLLVLL